ncbi:MAG: hypothetical protein ABW252_12585 [Polyangiales bacterium]
MSTRGASLLAVTATFLVACGETPAPTRRPQGLLTGEEVAKGPVNLPKQEPVPAPPPPSSLPSPFVKAAPNPGALSNPDAGGAGEPTAGAESAQDAAPPRDLARELTALLGQPGTCLDLAVVEKSGGRATVTATASVVPSGRITRASIEVPGQPSSAVKCLEQRLTSGSLKGPIPGAPLQVRASVPIEVVAATRGP